MRAPLSSSEFSSFFDQFRLNAFRLEILDVYSVVQEARDFERFLCGKPLPESKNELWCERVAQLVRSHRIIKRVHALTYPLSSYVKFEIEWRYVYNAAAGEEIYLVDREVVADHISGTSDFWLFDDDLLVVMEYDKMG
jgi:hypothetical protein